MYVHVHVVCVAIICIIIDNVEAKTELKENISGARETLSNSERIAGKWNKEDKVIIIISIHLLLLYYIIVHYYYY